MTSNLFCDMCGAAFAAGTDSCPACGQVHRSHVPARHSSRCTELPTGFLLRQRYRILKKIGQGGFGVVYKARDTRIRRFVAIKEITLAALNAREMIEVTDSYNREITLLSRLHHPHLADIYDHFTDPEHWYIVLQYIGGETLEEKCGKTPGGRLEVGEVLHIGAQLCEVLGYLHVQDPPVIFRDVKPANVMIVGHGGPVFLIDFGIARRYREGQDRDTGPLGSPGYAAPEQYGRAQSTPRTDMYGLGATLQTLLTGKVPWEIQAEGLPVDCTIPPELQALLTRLLDPNPVNRPAFMWSVGRSLRDLQKRYPVPAPPSKKRTKYPFSWITTIWVLCLFVIVLFILSRHSLLYFVALGFWGLALCWVGGQMIFRFSRTRRGVARKLTRQERGAVLKEGLVNSWYLVLQFFANCCAIGILTIDGKARILLIVCLILAFAGDILVALGERLLIFRREKHKHVTQEADLAR